MSILVAWMLVSLNSPTGGTVPVSELPPALRLFRSVCIEGGSTLKKNDVEVAVVRDVPADAQRALEFSTIPDRVPASRASNNVYRIRGDHQMYLLVPQSSGAGATDVYARSCAVIWKADEYAQAKKMIIPVPDPEGLRGTLPKDNPMGFAHSSTDNGDLNLTVAAFQGWTVLRSARSTGNPWEKVKSVNSR